VQVYRNPEPQMFSLEVGPNVDIAFLTICTAAIDLLQLRQDVAFSLPNNTIIFLIEFNV
jgi:hypothetical protein